MVEGIDVLEREGLHGLVGVTQYMLHVLARC